MLIFLSVGNLFIIWTNIYINIRSDFIKSMATYTLNFMSLPHSSAFVFVHYFKLNNFQTLTAAFFFE